MSFPRYPKYRDSGVEWLGQVPEHWDVRRLRQIGPLLKGCGGSKEDVVETGVPCVRYGDLYTTHAYMIRQARTCVTEERSIDYFPVRRGDVLFAASGEDLAEIGRSAVVLFDERACCGGDLVVLRPDVPAVPEFMGYACDCWVAKAQKASMGRGTTVKHIYPDELKMLLLAAPPLPEQTAIAAFLDRETAKIDALIAEQQRLIQLLQEKRQAVISHAVTKGLNPDVPMKDSGIEWLGEVPEHWTILPSRRLFGQRNESAKATDKQVTASQKYGIVFQADFVEMEGRRVVETITGTHTLRRVHPNDFVISLRSFQGGIEWCRIQGSITFHYVVLTPLKCVYEPFFAHLFKSDAYIQALRSTTNLIRDGQDLRYSHFVQVPLPVVPLEEQRKIAAHLDTSVAQFDVLASEASNFIALLQERRSALISAAVTGQIDVRGLAGSEAA